MRAGEDIDKAVRRLRNVRHKAFQDWGRARTRDDPGIWGKMVAYLQSGREEENRTAMSIPLIRAQEDWLDVVEGLEVDPDTLDV